MNTTPITSLHDPAWLDMALALRANHWNLHPIVQASAKLPTRASKEVIEQVYGTGVLRRGSLAWWSHPGTGKTTCIELVREHLPVLFPGAGLFLYEAKVKDQDAKLRQLSAGSEERIFIGDLLEEMGYELRIEFALPARRRQLYKALMSGAGPARHLFIIIDEAQELNQRELSWLKTAINRLIAHGYKVTTLLFGQFELIQHRNTIATSFRSDLDLRFTKTLMELQGVCSADDLAVPLLACDSESEYPVGSGLTYTQLLFPIAFSRGFRLANVAVDLWKAFLNASALRPGETGIAMEYVAAALSALVRTLRERDGPNFSVPEKDLELAVRASGYARRKQVRAVRDATPKGEKT